MSTQQWTTPERIALREMVDAFTRKEIVPNIAGWERDGALPKELHRKAAELGLLELGVAEAAGGMGDYIDFFIANEQIILSGGSSGLCSALMTHSIATPHIVASGDTHLIDKYVRPTIAGEMIGSLGVTEPGTGSDVGAIATRAVRTGDHYVVNGAKTFITSGTRADFVTTAVRTGGPGHRGVSLLVIDTDSPGFSVTSKLDKMGWLCSDTAELSFDDVAVPAENLVGPEGTGFLQLMRRFESERLLMAVQAVATAQRCLDLTVDWAHNRVTFGEPLAARQVIRHRLAEMGRQVCAARAYVRDVVSRWAAGDDVNTEVAMAKNTAVYACDFVTNEAVQIHGGMGFMRESEVERHYRDERVLGIGGGTNEMMNEIIAKDVVDRAKGAI
ncbi:acyl-CoA dehydrogenase [Gordonia sp. TBRC 11910]|uniref:Acyl-CoA dehydrogenase n=1 Tax=Gordonia asplenii TaxID=2725283 RepID=A0A848KWH5_9ACTN|nr:acyl-CoA dehydrogenase family protein [Gordonia asplenii]NMO02649.1 acyl-CoA dehydrogenase [Gordonia asplenii]